MVDKPWDDTDFQQDSQLTSAEWNNHVSEGHFPADEVNFGVDPDGNPVMTDPQNSGETIATYDRAAGRWVYSGVEANILLSDQVHDVMIYKDGSTFRAVDQNGVIGEVDHANFAGITTLFRDALTAADDASPKSGYVRVMPETGVTITLQQPDTASDPYMTVPGSVTLDIRGTYLRTNEDASALFDMSPSGTLLGHGAYIFVDQLSGAGIKWSSAGGSNGVQDGGKVIGYPQFADSPAGFFAVELSQGDGGSVSGTKTEVHLDNADGAVSVQSTGAGGFVNDNEVHITGACSGGSTRGSSATTNLVEFVGSETMRSNRIYAEQIQVKGTPDDIARFEGGAAKNEVRGIFADMYNAANGYTFTAAVSDPQTVTTAYGTIAVTNNSGVAHDFIGERGGNLITQDLTSLSGVAGQVVTHDGTDGASAVPWGQAQWDPNRAAGAGNWVSLVDGTVFGPN